VRPARFKPGTYRNIWQHRPRHRRHRRPRGAQAFYGSYPITPASDILHELSRHKNLGVITFQAEGRNRGAGRGGSGVVRRHAGGPATSGPMVLGGDHGARDHRRAAARAGGRTAAPPPAPTKTEQVDLLMAPSGGTVKRRPVLAAATPGDCFTGGGGGATAVTHDR
jgi:2-oxoglutarate ferredoxin oxidoreductase subunit alpha